MIPNKLLVALLTSAFAFGSVAARADGQTPAQPVDPAKLKAEKDAKAKAAAMTREEKAAARKAKRAERDKKQEWLWGRATSGRRPACRQRRPQRNEKPKPRNGQRSGRLR
jgi:Ni/Co efflux regulator RcnB